MRRRGEDEARVLRLLCTDDSRSAACGRKGETIVLGRGGFTSSSSATTAGETLGS